MRLIEHIARNIGSPSWARIVNTCDFKSWMRITKTFWCGNLNSKFTSCVHNMDPQKRLIIMINCFMATEEISKFVHKICLRAASAAFGVCNLINLLRSRADFVGFFFILTRFLLFVPRFCDAKRLRNQKKLVYICSLELLWRLTWGYLNSFRLKRFWSAVKLCVFAQSKSHFLCGVSTKILRAT